MNLSSRELLARLGAGEPLQAVCAAAGVSPEKFQSWWQAESRSRAPEQSGSREAAISAGVRIDRDRWGIPRISAETDEDLFFGFGYAMAQDRLFQLDYLRRKAAGRLSEVLGPDGLEMDVAARTIGIARIAEAEWERTPAETRSLLIAFSGGIDASIAAAGERLPIEFDLLDYTPEPWSPVDCLAIAGEFRAYLTVRLPVIFIPELGKRVLGEGALYRAFLQGEADDESIVPPGAYPPDSRPPDSRPSDSGPSAQAGTLPVGQAISDPSDGVGSNNWVLAGSRSATGAPMIASDPHIAFAAVSCWYEVTLTGGSFDVTGMAYAGMPAVMFGRNRRVGWGITNNICSQRDLYVERTDPTHPGAFLYGGRWEPAGERTERIEVRGRETVARTIRSSRNGPIVDELLPEPARAPGPISLRWLGATCCRWLTSLLAMDRATTVAELRQAVRGWRVPTWSLMLADADGHIGYQVAGEIPLRAVEERGYRPGWDPAHAWQGVVPWEAMPQLADPERGWIASANNRPAPADFPYSLSGRWASGYRARRIRQMLEARKRHAREDFARMQMDVLSLRAVTCLPPLLQAVAAHADAGHADPRIRQAAERLAEWDCRMETDRIGATIFEVFFGHWSTRVAAERFSDGTAALVAGAVAGLATALLTADEAGWFANGRREAAIAGAMTAALDDLTERLGPDMTAWSWGRLHRIHLRHVLTQRGDLGALLDRGGLPVRGNGTTVCNTGFDPNWGAAMGANYRMIADLGTEPPGLWAVDAQGQSGHPGSPHYCDQLAEWLAGRYHFLPLDRSAAARQAVSTLRLVPRG
jgi:penicillin amidase